jgi:hypothetical protein
LGLVSSLIHQSQQLTRLVLGPEEIDGEQVAAAVSSLQGLQSFKANLAVTSDRPANDPAAKDILTAGSHEVLSMLPSSLTALQLSTKTKWSTSVDKFQRLSIPWPALRTTALSQLTALRALHAEQLTLQASQLAGQPGLQHLVLEHVTVKAPAAAAAAAAAAAGGAAAAGAAADALACLDASEQLTQLQHLEVTWQPMGRPAAC